MVDEMEDPEVTLMKLHAQKQAAEMRPALRTLGAYEREFSKRLKRKIVIQKTPGKRQ